MKFLVDANLPFKLALKLKELGFDTIHTDELTNKEKTTDKEIRKVSLDQDRIVITKDSDFLDSHLLQTVPEKLLYISTGNITNRELLSLLEKYIVTITKLFDIYDLIELTNDEIMGHEK
jgi:predicted nuclease of predicted toxin-antitoxin system